MTSEYQRVHGEFKRVYLDDFGILSCGAEGTWYNKRQEPTFEYCVRGQLSSGRSTLMKEMLSKHSLENPKDKYLCITDENYISGFDSDRFIHSKPLRGVGFKAWLFPDLCKQFDNEFNLVIDCNLKWQLSLEELIEILTLYRIPNLYTVRVRTHEEVESLKKPPSYSVFGGAVSMEFDHPDPLFKARLELAGRSASRVINGGNSTTRVI